MRWWSYRVAGGALRAECPRTGRPLSHRWGARGKWGCFARAQDSLDHGGGLGAFRAGKRLCFVEEEGFTLL